MAASWVAYIKCQCKRYLLIVTLCKKWRYKCTTPPFMHHDSEKIQAIHSSVTALGLLKKKERKKERWTKCVGGDIYNTDLRDSDEIKGCSKRGYPCIACLNGLNRDILRHNEGIWQNTYQCLYRRHFEPLSTWQPILASLQASLHAHIPCTQLQVYITPWNFDAA